MPRVFAVLAAILLVGSVALASLLPEDMSLAQALQALGGGTPADMQRELTAAVGSFITNMILGPILIRPVWMIPVSLGLICVGGAVTALTQGAPRPRQRRS
jgi:hypothetical protein